MSAVPPLSSGSGSPSSHRQPVALQLLLAVELDDAPGERALDVRAPRVDGQRAPDTHGGTALVDVPVEREDRLDLFDHLPDGRRAHMSGVLPLYRERLPVDLRRHVELRVVRRRVKAQDEALGTHRDLRHDPLDARLERRLVLLPWRVPRREVRPAARGELVALRQVDDVALAELDLRRGGEQPVDVGAVVVAGAHDAAHAGADQTLVGPGDPVLDGAAHLLMKELVELVGVARELVSLFGSHDRRVVAMVADRALIERQRVGTVEIVADVLHVIGVLATAVVDDRDDRLARHVAAKDEDVGVVVLAGVDELTPAGLRAVHVRGEEEPHAHVGIPCAALMYLSICRLAPFSTREWFMRSRGCAGRPGGRRKTWRVDVAATPRAARRSRCRSRRLRHGVLDARTTPCDEPQTMRVVRALPPT